MRSVHDPEEFDLDIYAQQERINTIYTQVIFSFKVSTSDNTTLWRLLNSLDKALIKLHEAFPWTSGSVHRVGGNFKISAPNLTSRSVLTRDLRDDAAYPDLTTLSALNYPYKWLDEQIVSHRGTIADVAELETAEGMPVFVVHLNVLRGGVLISFEAQHGAMDMTGQMKVIRFFAKACRGEVFTADETASGNLNRKNVVRMLNESEMETHPQQVPDAGSKPANQMQIPLCWAYFSFNVEALQSLKRESASDIPAEGFISTDDALSAFIWKAIAQIRLRRLGHTAEHLSSSSTLSRNVDGRRCLSLPPTYPGLVVTSTLHTKSLKDLSDSSLSDIAKELRAALSDTAKLKRQLQTQATLLDQGKALPTTSASSNPALDVRLSSWAKEGAYGIDFGLGLSCPDAVRTPRFDKGAREGLVYFLPKERDGSVVVGICLREDDMEALRGSEMLNGRCTYIG